MEKPKITVAGGGTGGHIMPALALCDAFANRHTDAIVHYAGRPDSMEQRMAADAGLKFIPIQSASFKKGILSKISFFIKVSLGLFQSIIYIVRFKPDYIVGFGGYTSFPLLITGLLLKKNVTVHESNAVPGKVVRMLVKYGAKFAYGVNAGNEKMRMLIEYATNKSDACQTGTPIRKSILNASAENGFKSTGFNNRNPVILIVGGSQGSLCLNTTVADGMCLLNKTFPEIQVVHITGRNYEENVEKKYDDSKINNLVITFSDNVGELYKIADVAVTRAGALTVSELSATGLPAILIPFPYATDDHQKENAEIMENAGCAKVICEDMLTSEMIYDVLKEIISNESTRNQMSNSALLIAKPDADELLCDFIENNINN